MFSQRGERRRCYAIVRRAGASHLLLGHSWLVELDGRGPEVEVMPLWSVCQAQSCTKRGARTVSERGAQKGALVSDTMLLQVHSRDGPATLCATTGSRDVLHNLLRQEPSCRRGVRSPGSDSHMSQLLVPVVHISTTLPKVHIVGILYCV